MHSNETEKMLTILTERLERLEKHNGRLTRIALAMGAVLLLVVTLGAVTRQPDTQETARTQDPVVVSPGDIPGLVVTQEVVRTKNLQIVDDDGILRASLEIKEADTFEGNPMLTLFDEGGNARAILSLFAGNPGLWLNGEDGNFRASLYLAAGKPVLNFWDDNGNIRTELYLNEGGAPTFRMKDEDGNPRATLSLWAGDPLFCLRDADLHVLFGKP
jgi:hypothetical protein